MMFAEGDLVWSPSPASVENTQLSAFLAWLQKEHGRCFASYGELQSWSVQDQEGFWRAVWDYAGIIGDGRFDRVVSGPEMIGSRWFAGARVNYAEHLLRHESDAEPGEIAVIHGSEARAFAELSWHDLGDMVRTAATQLRALGIRSGDRVVAYLPNTVEAVVAMLATTAIGGIWSSAAPEFGAQAVIDRFSQIEPVLLLATDGYRFGGKDFDRRSELATIVASLPSLKTVVMLPFLGLDRPSFDGIDIREWRELTSGPKVLREDFRYERVESDHPLWVLFTSGTTGLPKAIVHNHVGIVVDQIKTMRLSFDLTTRDRMFFYTTTGWMMWNAVISALFAGATAILYDGNPAWPNLDRLWEIAARTRATICGASPTLIKMMERAGIKPNALHDLSALHSVLLGGAPSTPADYAWLCDNVKADIRIINTSGGTELCGSLVGPVPIHDIRAGEIQGRMLGIAVESWNDEGRAVVDEVGELVITKPFPSMPLYLWGDKDNQRYREAYFDVFPGVWRHGDLIKFNAQGGCYIYGRADSTLNRHGVRIGTSEIYRVLAGMEQVRDSIIVCCETRSGNFFMPLFVQLQDGAQLDEALISEINRRLRVENSPRHVPDEIRAVPGIPYTLAGKKMEVPLRKILMGASIAAVASPEAMANPGVIDWYADYARAQRVRELVA